MNIRAPKPAFIRSNSGHVQSQAGTTVAAKIAAVKSAANSGHAI
jgi:hypothetical protein